MAMSSKVNDPRSEAEKARADLMRNAELGLSVPESPVENQPSVTPATFGDTTKAARLRAGLEEGLESGGVSPTVGKGAEAQAPVEGPQRSVGRDRTAPVREASETAGDEDILSRAKE
jgi:hypothetical protein